jgi:DNA-binding NarL/FixJ family response regulator
MRKRSAVIMTILIAEDDPLLCCCLADLLAREEGFEVAGSIAVGPDTLEAAARLRPDVILLDLPLPDLSALDILEQLSSRPYAPPILVLSGDDQEPAQLDIARSGARGFLSKEQAIITLSPAIRAVARGELWYSPRICDLIFREFCILTRHERERQRPAGQLTDREREVLVRLARGLTNNQIAAELFMSVHTVKLHVQHIFRKLNLPNRTEAAVFAVREGLLDLPSERLSLS